MLRHQLSTYPAACESAGAATVLASRGERNSGLGEVFLWRGAK